MEKNKETFLKEVVDRSKSNNYLKIGNLDSEFPEIVNIRDIKDILLKNNDLLFSIDYRIYGIADDILYHLAKYDITEEDVTSFHDHDSVMDVNNEYHNLYLTELKKISSEELETRVDDIKIESPESNEILDIENTNIIQLSNQDLQQNTSETELEKDINDSVEFKSIMQHIEEKMELSLQNIKRFVESIQLSQLEINNKINILESKIETDLKSNQDQYNDIKDEINKSMNVISSSLKRMIINNKSNSKSFETNVSENLSPRYRKQTPVQKHISPRKKNSKDNNYSGRQMLMNFREKFQ